MRILAANISLDEVEVNVEIEPFLIWKDNRAAIDYTKNLSNSNRMRHLDRALRWIRAEVEKGTVELRWIETTDQLADVFTKALVAGSFWSIISRLLKYSH